MAQALAGLLAGGVRDGAALATTTAEVLAMTMEGAVVTIVAGAMVAIGTTIMSTTATMTTTTIMTIITTMIMTTTTIMITTRGALAGVGLLSRGGGRHVGPAPPLTFRGYGSAQR